MLPTYLCCHIKYATAAEVVLNTSSERSLSHVVRSREVRSVDSLWRSVAEYQIYRLNFVYKQHLGPLASIPRSEQLIRIKYIRHVILDSDHVF